MKSGNLNFLEQSGPLQACNGSDLPLPLALLLPFYTYLSDIYSKQNLYKGLKKLKNPWTVRRMAFSLTLRVKQLQLRENIFTNIWRV